MMPRISFALGAASLALSVAFVAGLKSLPYSSSSLQEVELTQAEAPPSDKGLDVGSLHWDFEVYRTAPSLEPLRAFKRTHCEGAIGLEAAVCVSNAFAKLFPHGTPRHEFVDAVYDPASELAEHIAGSPGHCVTRSGLLAAMLLASGQPARVTQFISPTAVGHNVIEVWVPNSGWVLFDPTYGGTITEEQRPLSAAVAANNDALQWMTHGTPAILDFDPRIVYTNADTALLRQSTVLYPEPWLYTRVGPRAASLPFRGAFAHIGGQNWRLGPAQRLCHWGFALSAAAGVVLLGVGILGASRNKHAFKAAIDTPIEGQPHLTLARSDAERGSGHDVGFLHEQDIGSLQGASRASTNHSGQTA